MRRGVGRREGCGGEEAPGRRGDQEEFQERFGEEAQGEHEADREEEPQGQECAHPCPSEAPKAQERQRAGQCQPGPGQFRPAADGAHHQGLQGQAKSRKPTDRDPAGRPAQHPLHRGGQPGQVEEKGQEVGGEEGKQMKIED
ncbi:MAG: hypothetical protein D6790_09370 [Caldilineae bacterium]|nr:MAG: hypothetical protein D6790_09370 [Caldilineae bacterium]